jgi:hypothetical protein
MKNDEKTKGDEQKTLGKAEKRAPARMSVRIRTEIKAGGAPGAPGAPGNPGAPG